MLYGRRARSRGLATATSSSATRRRARLFSGPLGKGRRRHASGGGGRGRHTDVGRETEPELLGAGDLGGALLFDPPRIIAALHIPPPPRVESRLYFSDRRLDFLQRIHPVP